MKIKVDNIEDQEADPISHFEIYVDDNIIIYEVHNYRTDFSYYTANTAYYHCILYSIFENEDDYNMVIKHLEKPNRIVMNLLFSENKAKKELGLNILKNI